MNISKKLVAGVAAAVVAAGGGIFMLAGGADAATTVACKWGSYPLCPYSVGDKQLTPDLKAKVNKVGTKGDKGVTGPQGPKGDTGAVGPTGPAGTNGNDAILSVMAVSSLVDRPDSGLHGGWALDNLTRTVSITRQKAAKASNCGGTATKCWFYTGSIADNGSFATVAGGKSPEAGADIAGTVNGTVAGASQIEFYASSDAPNPALVDATVTGSAHPTGEWVKMFFPAGTVTSATDLLDWSWTYNAPATCEKWVNAKAGNTGDVTGVNAC